jgi:hypothetical protein
MFGKENGCTTDAWLHLHSEQARGRYPGVRSIALSAGVQDAPDSFGTVIVLLKRGGGSTQWSSGWHTVASRFVDFGVRCPGGRTVLRDLIHVEVTGSQSRGCSDNMFYLYIFLATAAKEIAGSGSSPSLRCY